MSTNKTTIAPSANACETVQIFSGVDTPIVGLEFLKKTMTMEWAELLIPNWDRLKSFFKKSTLKKAIKNYNVEDFAGFVNCPVDGWAVREYIPKGYPVVYDTIQSRYVMEYSEHNGGGWSRMVDKDCWILILPNKYQLEGKNLLRDCLIEEYPYLYDYNMTVYNFDSDNEEVYISTRHIRQQGTNKWVWSDDIYCPIKAFKEHNSQLIIDRHTSYFSDFYRDRPEYKAKCLAFVENDIAKKLFKDVDKKENKPKESKSIDKKEAK